MAENIPPVRPPDPSSNQPAPEDLRLQGAKAGTQVSMMLRAGLEGLQQALQREKAHAADRAKKTKEIYDQ